MRLDSFVTDVTGLMELPTIPPPGPEWLPVPGHERLVANPALPGFDASGETLTLQYPATLPDPTLSDALNPLVEIFAGDYFLGSLSFIRPWYSLCDRSSDGSMVAFAPKIGWNEFIEPWQPADIQWFELDDIRNVFRLPFTARADDLAFQPGSHTLAFFGYITPSRGVGQGLYILDLDNLDFQQMMVMNSATSLTWSPKGDALAIIGNSSAGADNPEILVLEVPSGQILYRAPYNPTTKVIPADSPTLTWKSQFPRPIGGLERCLSNNNQ
jgi:hypothetical protein